MEVNYSLLIFSRYASWNSKKFLLVNLSKQRASCFLNAALVVLWRTEGRAAVSRLEYRIKRLPAAEKRRLVESPHLVSQLEGLAGEDDYLPVFW